MEKVERIKARESKQLESLRKKAAKAPYAGYLIVIMIIAILIHSVDEITTLVGNNIKSSWVTEFFVQGRGMTFNEGLSYLSALGLVSFVIMLIVPFYKALADKYGRKIFLVLNTLGMAVGMLISMLSKSFAVYFIGTLIGSFFIAHDMQVVYILEVAPPNKRARFYGITKAIGTLGFVLLPLMRRAFMGDDPTRWRMVYLVPIILTVVIALIALFFARESSPFLKGRLEQLEIPYEERLARDQEAKLQKKANKEKTGVFPALKYIFKHKELKWVIIIILIYYLCVAGMGSFYEPIMYAANMPTADITNALFMYGFMFAAVILIAGFMGDAIGRKATAAIFGILSIGLFILFVYSAQHAWNPYLVGAFYGLYLGCFWQGGDYLSIIAAEKLPTSIRSSGAAALALILMIGAMVGNIYMSIALRFTSISNAILYQAIPSIVIAMILLIWKVKETKGVDLTTVGQEEEPTSI